MTLPGWIVWAALTLGAWELLVTMVNRLHARPIAGGKLRKARRLHHFGIPAAPALLALLFPPWREIDFASGTAWSALQIAVAVFLGVGFAGFIFSAVRHRVQSLFAPGTRTSEPVAIPDSLDLAKLRGGRRGSLSRLPGNQILAPELAQLALPIDDLPAELDGLRILHLSDWHMQDTLPLAYFEAVVAAAERERFDLVALTGDLLDDMACLDWLDATFGRLSAPLGCWFILGNHDWNLDPAAIRERMASLGWFDLAGKTAVVEHEGFAFELAGDETPWLGEPPPEPGDRFRILLAHTPDRFPAAVRDGVPLVLAGHTHGGQVRIPGVGPVYAPSVHGVRYASGRYRKGKTTLVVSRGLAGEHPLRIRCRPEIAIVTLKTRR